MDKTIKALFDYQKFEGNSRLAAMIADTEKRYAVQLDDADLEFVNAAGNIDADALRRPSTRKDIGKN